MTTGERIPQPSPDDLRHVGDRIQWRMNAEDSELGAETSVIVATRISTIAHLRILHERGEMSDAEFEEGVTVNEDAIDRILKLETDIATEALRRTIGQDGETRT